MSFYAERAGPVDVCVCVCVCVFGEKKTGSLCVCEYFLRACIQLRCVFVYVQAGGRASPLSMPAVPLGPLLKCWCLIPCMMMTCIITCSSRHIM